MAHAEDASLLISYYLVVGITSDAGESGPAAAAGGNGGGDGGDGGGGGGGGGGALGAEIVERFPLEDDPTNPLPPSVPLFCCPDGVDVIPVGHPDARSTSMFTFTLTDGNGARSYGTCLSFYEPLAPGSPLAGPRAICMLSRWPFYSLPRAFMWLVFKLYAEARDGGGAGGPLAAVAAALPLEMLTASFVMGARVPSRGLCLDMSFGGRVLHFARAGGRVLPPLDSYCFRVLFECLDAENVVYLVSCLLMEQRVLIHSMDPARLGPVSEALMCLLFPFCWEHVYARIDRGAFVVLCTARMTERRATLRRYVPMLPLQLIEYLQAPVPFIMGVHTTLLGTNEAVDALALAAVVHLDQVCDGARACVRACVRMARGHACVRGRLACARVDGSRARGCACVFSGVGVLFARVRARVL